MIRTVDLLNFSRTVSWINLIKDRMHTICQLRLRIVSKNSEKNPSPSWDDYSAAN
jgi:hypothetical protein